METRFKFKGRNVLWDSNGFTLVVRGEKKVYENWNAMAKAVTQQNESIQWKKKSARLRKWL